MLSADAYGQGEADSLLGRALAGVPRESYSLVGAVGHDFYEGERDGPKGFPRFTDPALRGPEASTATTCGWRPSAASSASAPDRFDLLLLHNPDRTGYESEAVWDGMAALRDAGLAGSIGVAPGPANGFTLDLIALPRALRRPDRLGDGDPEPVRALAGRALPGCGGAHGVGVITRVVDYGGIFWDDVTPGHRAAQGRPPRVPARGLDRGGPGEARPHAPDRRAARA